MDLYDANIIRLTSDGHLIFQTHNNFGEIRLTQPAIKQVRLQKVPLPNGHGSDFLSVYFSAP